MTASRPSPVRKITPKVEAARKKAVDQTESIRIDGVVYTIRAGDITGLMEHEFRRITGMSVRGMVDQMYRDPGLDTFAAFVFMAKTLNGAETTFEAELEALNYDSDFDVDAADAEPTPAPEA